jgi:hypothetical protein
VKDPKGKEEEEWLTSCPGCFIAEKEPRYPITMRLGGTQNRSGRFLPEFEPRIETPNYILNKM